LPQHGCDVTVPLRFAQNPASLGLSLWTTSINVPVPLTRPFVPMPAPVALLKNLSDTADPLSRFFGCCIYNKCHLLSKISISSTWAEPASVTLPGAPPIF
jgi:hypothetical protein